jgi:hypothetical protein
VVSDFFPDTAKFLAKVYAIDADGQKRFENAVGEPLAPSEQKLAVITAFRGEMAPTGPELWPQDPVHLDQLLPRDRMGFVAFVPVMLGKEPVSVGIALDRELRIAGVAPATADAKMRDKLTAALKVFNGLGGRGTALKDPNDRSVKAPAELKKSMAKAYWRVREASTMFQKEERDRHWADPDAFSVEAGEDELKVKNKQ